MKRGHKERGVYIHKVWTTNRKADCHPEQKHYGLGLCYTCYNKVSNIRRKKQHQTWYQKNKKRLSEIGKTYKTEAKFIVLEHYTEGVPHCACCNEKHLEFLTIDHIDGGGNAHRKAIKKHGGEFFYRWLIKNNFPDGFRVLCMNCNWGRSRFGYCPHNLQTT